MSNSTSTDAQPYLGRCKECDYALFATPEDVKIAESASDVKAGAGAFRWNNMVLGRCNNRHRWFALKRIKGTYSKDHKCDSRCLNAKGHDCTCSCGGANHGRGHAVQVIEAGQLPAQYAEPATDKQVAFIRRLLDEREIPDNDTMSGEERRISAHKLLDEGKISKQKASTTIEWLMSLPKVPS
jgi:hypothetical protein